MNNRLFLWFSKKKKKQYIKNNYKESLKIITTKSIGGGNGLNIYLNYRVHDFIPTIGKNSGTVLGLSTKYLEKEFGLLHILLPVKKSHIGYEMV
jgi:hypothetical protein